jgi:transcriptional regulator with XRE-family HTH domain
MPSDGIGDRLARARKLSGLTQRELASRSGVSLSLIRKLEQGERNDTRLETARRLAAAVGVPTTQLKTAEATDAEPARGSDAALWSAVRVAVEAAPSDDLDEAPILNGVRTELDAAITRYAAGDLLALSHALPGLIRDARALTDVTPRGTGVFAEVMQITGRVMTQTRNYEVASAAFDLVERNAPGTMNSAGATTGAGCCCVGGVWRRRESWRSGGRMTWSPACPGRRLGS